MRRKVIGLLSAALGLASAGAVTAREPGVPGSVPPGYTMGVRIGTTPPPGVYFSSHSAYWDAEVKDGNGDSIGQTNDLFDTAAQFFWVPDTEVLGASYMAFTTIPLLYIEQDRTDPFPPPLQGSDSLLGLGNIEINPATLSWQIRPGIFASAGLSIFAPTGKFDPDEAINTGGDFWTIAPQVGFSYLRDGWNLSASAGYFISTANATTDYRSGDELVVNATAFKDLGGWSVGPVGYWLKQTTADSNDGTYYGGATFGKVEQAGLGLGVEKRFGRVLANVNVTTDLYVRESVGGTKFWFNFTMPLSTPR